MNAKALLASKSLLLSASAAFVCSSASADDARRADLVLINGEVKTEAGWAQAMAVRDGVIIAVGDSKAMRALAEDGAEILNLNGATVMPGLHDMHVHALFAGLEMSHCGFEPGATPDKIAAAVSKCVAEAAPGEWILGGNWVGAVFKPGEQTKEFLDKIAPENPVVLGDESHHTIWVNSKALELAGVTKATPDPDGGVIDRDENGEPTGVLRETAASLVERIVPEAPLERRKEALIRSTQEMLSFGITSFMEASIREDNIGVYAALSESGEIKQRVRGCIAWQTHGENGASTGFDAGTRLISQRAFHERPRYKLDCVKVFLDGVPTESRTGAMVEPYINSDGSVSNERGILMIDQGVLEDGIARFDHAGLTVKFHAAGDGAVRAALDAVEHSREANGWDGPRHHVGHSTFVTREDIPRAKALNVAWEFSPYIWYPTPMVSVDIANAVGEERMKRWSPIKEAHETGALVAVGSDWSVVPSVNPWLALETMITREKPGGGDKKEGEAEKVAREDAFEIMIDGGARLMGHRDQVGALGAGMLADFVIVRPNPYKVPVRKLHATTVEKTYIGGEKVFDRSASGERPAQTAGR